MTFIEKSRTVGVPRGLLKFLVLKMINEKPVSGAEIVEEIEKQLSFGRDFIKRIEFLAPMLVGGLDIETNNERFRKPKESTKNLLKSFIIIRQNSDKLSEKDTEELSAILEDCNNKIRKIVNKIKDTE